MLARPMAMAHKTPQFETAGRSIFVMPRTMALAFRYQVRGPPLKFAPPLCTRLYLNEHDQAPTQL